MDESIAFYTKNLGMKLLSRWKVEQNSAEIAFLGVRGHRAQD